MNEYRLTLFMTPAAKCQANDLYQIRIQTIEWLVDQSDTIAFIRFQEDKAPEVLRYIKRRMEDLKFPLDEPAPAGYSYLRYPHKSVTRLCFIRKNVLLEQIGVGRQDQDEMKLLPQRLYGVSQYGELYLKEQVLFDAVAKRLKKGPGQPVKANTKRPHTKVSGTEAGDGFALESSDETFVLIVPYTTQRRNHYIERLQKGTPHERIDAIRKLRDFGDSLSWKAIRLAGKIESIEPAFDYQPPDGVGTGIEGIKRAVQNAMYWCEPKLDKK